MGRLVQARRHRCNNLIGRHRKARNGRRKVRRSCKCLAGPVAGAGTMSKPKQGGRQDLERPDDTWFGEACQGRAECQHVPLHQADASVGGTIRCLTHTSWRKPGGGAQGTSRGHGKTKVAMLVKIGVDLMGDLCPSGDDHLDFPIVPYPLWTAEEARTGIG